MYERTLGEAVPMQRWVAPPRANSRFLGSLF
jgi:hypothetical protein